jgi:hypothetical protein
MFQNMTVRHVRIIPVRCVREAQKYLGDAAGRDRGDIFPACTVRLRWLAVLRSVRAALWRLWLFAKVLQTPKDYSDRRPDDVGSMLDRGKRKYILVADRLSVVSL